MRCATAQAGRIGEAQVRRYGKTTHSPLTSKPSCTFSALQLEVRRDRRSRPTTPTMTLADPRCLALTMSSLGLTPFRRAKASGRCSGFSIRLVRPVVSTLASSSRSKRSCRLSPEASLLKCSIKPCIVAPNVSLKRTHQSLRDRCCRLARALSDSGRAQAVGLSPLASWRWRMGFPFVLEICRRVSRYVVVCRGRRNCINGCPKDGANGAAVPVAPGAKGLSILKS